jgi:hypothetical protein
MAKPTNPNDAQQGTQNSQGYEDADERVARTDASRASRSATEDSDREGRAILEMTQEERSQFLRDEFTSSSLPSVPELPGYHLCWLSTNNQYDTIMRRVRLGYRMVRSTELPPGYSSLSIKTGEHEGGIATNEMVLFKIPTDVYQALMKTFHHDMPAEEQEKLKRTWEQLKSGELGNKPMIAHDVGDGTEELMRRERKNPVFA